MAANGTSLAAALVAFQKDAPKIPRSKEVSVKTDKGTYKFKYAPYDVIVDALRDPLAKNGLAFSQLLAENENGHPALRTILIHSSGERLEAVFPLPIRGGESAQQIGSLITYLRRYALVSVLGLATEEDDDGNHASGNTATVQPKAAKQPAKFEPPASVRGNGDDPERLAKVTRALLDAGAITQEQLDNSDKKNLLARLEAFAENKGIEVPA